MSFIEITPADVAAMQLADPDIYRCRFSSYNTKVKDDGQSKNHYCEFTIMSGTFKGAVGTMITSDDNKFGKQRLHKLVMALFGENAVKKGGRFDIEAKLGTLVDVEFGVNNYDESNPTNEARSFSFVGKPAPTAGKKKKKKKKKKGKK